MDKLRIELTDAQLNALRNYLVVVSNTNTPSFLRFNGDKHTKLDLAHTMMRIALINRLLMKVQVAWLASKEKYRITVPAEQGAALLAQWSIKDAITRVQDVQLVVGMIDQQLA